MTKNEASLTVGDRVTVAVPPHKADGWNQDGLAGLQGKTGSITAIKELNEHEQAMARKQPPSVSTHKVLVEFDTPAPPSWANGSERTAHWFDDDEVEEIEQFCGDCGMSTRGGHGACTGVPGGFGDDKEGPC